MPAAPGVTAENWGDTEWGPVQRYTLTSPAGLLVRILSYGGIIQSIEVPDQRGRPVNVALGFDTLADYVGGNAPYFGALVGRFANRIARGAFTLDGVSYQVPANDGPNSLHGGPAGFDKRIWTAAPFRRDGGVGVALRLASPDGDQGYPGALAVSVRYTVTDGCELRIDYRATADRPTVVNLTNHTYVNLTGDVDTAIYDHELWLNADRYTPVDEVMIPTGELAPVAGTPMDFTVPTAIGARLDADFDQLVRARGYDHNYVLNPGGGTGPRPAARVVEPTSGRTLTVLTDQPGIQLYSGNLLDGRPPAAGGSGFRRGAGLALETQHFPDSPNHQHFPSTVLRPGQVYRTTTIYQFAPCLDR